MQDDDIFVRVHESCLRNTCRMGAVGLIVGSYAAYADSSFALNPITDYAHLAGRGLIRHALPTAFGFSLFGATTCMLDNVRGKDKPFGNAIIGGFVGGFCAGARAHEPRWSLIWGFSGALMGFFARLFGTQFMLDDRKQCLEHINKTLDMKKIAHLAPKQLEANKPV